MSRIIAWIRRWLRGAEAIRNAPKGQCAICGTSTPDDNICAGCGPGGW